MKKILFTMILSCITSLMLAQTLIEQRKPFSIATTIGTGISLNIPGSVPVMWQAIGYYNITNRFSAGVGTGLSFYEKMLIPVFGNIRYKIGRTRKFTPYTELGAGYSFAPVKDANGGFFINPSFEVAYTLKNKLQLQLAVGYEFQKLERLKKQNDNYFSKEFSGSLRHNTISIRFGLRF